MFSLGFEEISALNCRCSLRRRVRTYSEKANIRPFPRLSTILYCSTVTGTSYRGRITSIDSFFGFPLLRVRTSSTHPGLKMCMRSLLQKCACNKRRHKSLIVDGPEQTDSLMFTEWGCARGISLSTVHIVSTYTQTYVVQVRGKGQGRNLFSHCT